MLEKIIEIDKSIYLFVNRLPHPEPVNWFFLFFDFATYAGAVWIVLCICFMLWGGKRARMLALWGLGVVGFTVLLNELLLKTVLIRRIRPFVFFEEAEVLALDPKTFSFPSGQTAGAFSVSTFFSLVFRAPAFTVFSFVFSLMTGVGRVYLGAHYPLDVLAGAVVGALCGGAAYLLY